ncbi:MAG: hypothetical protein WCR79_00425 [Fusobacterium sp.]
MLKYIKKYKRPLFIIVPLFFISFLFYLSVYKTEIVASVVFKIATRGNIKIEKLVFEKGSNYKKGVINLTNVKLYDSSNVKAGDIPKIQIGYSDLKIKNIDIYKPNVIFIREKNYYNLADIFVKTNSSKKKTKSEAKESNSKPILEKINISDASVIYIDKSYTKEIKIEVKNVNSAIKFFNGYLIDIKAQGNKEKEKYSLNFNTLSGSYDFNIIGKNIKMNENIFQYAYDSNEEINNVDGNLDIDFRINESGYFGTGKVTNGKANYKQLYLPISNINLDLKFLGEKIDIEGNYLLGEKDEGLFNLEYSKKDGTNINFKFKDLSYVSASSYKHLNDLKLKLDETNFNIVNINLKYKERLKVDVFFDSKNGIKKEKFSVNNIHGNLIYENNELRLKDINSNVILNTPKKKITRNIVTNFSYKDKLGEVIFELKNQGTMFPDIKIGLNFKLTKDKNIFSIDSNVLNLNGEYEYKNKILSLNQKNNFKFKYNIETKKLLDFQGFLTGKLEDKQIILDMKKINDEVINLKGKIKFKKEEKGKISGDIDIKNFLYDLEFNVNNLELKLKDDLVSTSFAGKIKGDKDTYLGNIDLKNLNYKSNTNTLNIQGIFGEVKLEKKDKLEVFFDGQIKKIKFKNLSFKGLKSSVSYLNNKINILNIENKYLKLSGKYYTEDTLTDLNIQLNKVDKNFINIQDYEYDINKINGRLYGKLDNLRGEINIKEGKVYINEKLPINISGNINYSNGGIFSEKLKLNENTLNFKYSLKEEKGAYNIDIFDSKVSKNILGSKVRIIGKVNGTIDKKDIMGNFRGTLSEIYYKGKKIPLVYLEGNIKNKIINFSNIVFQDEVGKDILFSKGYINIEKNNLYFQLPKQNLDIQEILKNSDLNGNIEVNGEIKGPLNKINYQGSLSSSEIKYKGNKIDNFKAVIIGDGSNAKLQEFIINYKDGTINLDGNYLIKDGKYKFNLKSSNIDLDFFNIILNKYGITNINGVGKIDLEISDLDMLGNIDVENFGLNLDKYNLYLSKLNGNIKIEKNKLTINKFAGILNEGTLNIKGIILREASSNNVIDSDNIIYNLILNGKNIKYSYEDYFDINFNTRIQLFKNKVVGNVTVNNGKIKNILKKDLGLITLIKNFIKEKITNDDIIEETKVEFIKSRGYIPNDLKINIGFNIDNGIKLDVEKTVSYISKLRGNIFGQGILQGNLKKLNFLGETSIKDGEFVLNGNKFIIDKALIIFNNRNEYIPDINPNIVFVTSSIINSKIFEISLSGLSKSLTFKIRSGDITSVNTLDSILSDNDALEENKYGNANLLLTNILGGQISDIIVNPIVDIFKEVFRLPQLRVSSNITAEQNQNTKEKEETLYGAYLEAEMPLYKDKIFGKMKFNFIGDSSSEKSNGTYGFVNYDVNLYNKINKNISWGVGAQKLRDDLEINGGAVNYYIELKFEKKFDF